LYGFTRTTSLIKTPLGVKDIAENHPYGFGTVFALLDAKGYADIHVCFSGKEQRSCILKIGFANINLSEEARKFTDFCCAQFLISTVACAPVEREGGGSHIGEPAKSVH
jgi:hypothetical protein